MPKPYKPSAGDLNEKAGGDQEMENREYQRQKAKPKPKPKSKPKPFVESTTVEPANTRRMAEYKRSLDLAPAADYRNEAKNAYHDAATGTPRRRVIARNDKDLAAQSRMDELVGGRRAKQRGGGPGQRPSNYSTPMDLGSEDYAMGGKVKRYARGGGIESKGKTKGRFV